MNRKNLFIGGMVLLLGYISFLMVKPFADYIIGSAILAFIFHPVYQKLKTYLGQNISALSIVVLAVLLAFIPFALVVSAVSNDAQDLAKDLEKSEVLNMTKIEQKIAEKTGRTVDIEKNLDKTLEKFFGSTVGTASIFLKKITSLMIGMSLMLFLLFYIVRDGKELLEWIKTVVPIEEEIQKDYYGQINQTTWAVIKGHVLVALLQGLIAGVGLWMAGVPNFAFWTFVMILFGLIPIIGTVIVWLPAAIYLILVGKVTTGIFLIIYGLIIVGIVDNLARPLAVDKEADLHPAAIIVGVLGGVYLFGAVGLFIGPIVIGAFKSIVLVAKNN